MTALGLILIGIGFSVVVFDIFTNRVKGKWLLAIIIPCAIGLLLIQRHRLGEFALGIGSMIVGVSLWIWLDYLHEKLHNKHIDLFVSFYGRIAAFSTSLAIYLLFRFGLYPATRSFLEHLQVLVTVPKLMSVVITFAVVYLIVVFAFGTAYATLHLALDKAGFSSKEALGLHDFFLYSALNIATQSYKDVLPKHWLLAWLSIAQIFIGIALVSIYLAGVFTFLVQKVP